ncbi:aminotransferase class I/II-fold pyridoxal phosphate-dependent enzyme [Methylopila sp. Yamaguchi]|uniref:aminotransferase class I/II-fold pyridoxal phosphate-dependent enzyme n=1 Tax=Methylopila sp. Yamaguchi TaxID=1437817 RepID=UPI000CA99808|nr:aminotransferase class I/II-fold pyridoxal phosphate-dependent enzyme [Methylopila sp. Yamaguchi]GBD49179.1 acyltransferase [Methylopila sp. Yamaguchi]
MSERRGVGALSRSAKDGLLSALRQSAPKKDGSAEAAAPRAKRARKAQLRFQDLPELKDIRTQQAVAELIGVGTPFFRVHDDRAGATTHIDGRTILNFASYNYLGLNGHPEVSAAAKAAIDRYGTSVSASRLVAGERPIHQELEGRIARFIGVEAAACFVSGHATNVSAIGHLMRQGDLVLYDSLAHNSIVVGATLSGATRRLFPHNDLDALEEMLIAHAHGHARVLVVVEGLYSMDGDFPDLKRLVALRERFGFWLMVDEAHSLGVLGKTGRGIAEEAGVDPNEVDIWMGTLSKTLSGCGGYIAGSAALCDYLKFSAPGFVYSVGMPPPVAGAAIASLDVLEREPERVAKLRAIGQRFVEKAKAAGLDVGASAGFAISPVMVGDSLRAVHLANRLLERGVNALPIIHPAVPERSARLRFFFTSEHEPAQIDEAVAVTADEHAKLAEAGFGIKMAAALAKATRPA